MKTFLIAFLILFVVFSFVNIPEALEECHWEACPDYGYTPIFTYHPNFYAPQACGFCPHEDVEKFIWKGDKLGSNALLAFLGSLVIFGIFEGIKKVKKKVDLPGQIP